jgi:hypothetical protein
LQLHRNFRVPRRSIIHGVFDGVVSDGTADENLAWWESSDGTQLPDQRLRVSTKKIGDTVYAMLIPV